PWPSSEKVNILNFSGEPCRRNTGTMQYHNFYLQSKPTALHCQKTSGGCSRKSRKGGRLCLMADANLEYRQKHRRGNPFLRISSNTLFYRRSPKKISH